MPSTGAIRPTEATLVGKAQWPAPTIRAAVGDIVEIRVKNLGGASPSAPLDPVAVELRGLDALATDKGVPETSRLAVPPAADDPTAGNVLVHLLSPAAPGTYIYGMAPMPGMEGTAGMDSMSDMAGMAGMDSMDGMSGMGSMAGMGNYARMGGMGSRNGMGSGGMGGMGQMGGMMGMYHPMHIHAVDFLVVERKVTPEMQAAYDTVRAGYVDEGWKDTVLVMPGETVNLAVQFGPYDGRYVYHCHILEHEDGGMMRNLQLNPVPGQPSSQGDDMGGMNMQ